MADAPIECPGVAKCPYAVPFALLEERYDVQIARQIAFERRMEEHFINHLSAHEELHKRVEFVEGWLERKGAVNGYISAQHQGASANRKFILSVLALLLASLGSSWGLIGTLVWMMER